MPLQSKACAARATVANAKPSHKPGTCASAGSAQCVSTQQVTPMPMT